MTAHIPIRQPDILASWPSDDLQWAQESFHEWQREGIRGLRECDNNPREDADFDEWLGQMSQPHIKDCERFRAARLSDAELVGHSVQQRKFLRENRT